MGQTRKRHDAGTFQPHVKKGDEVLVLAGRSKGERGRVVSVDPQRERAVVEGVNLITKHQKAQGFNQNRAAQQQSGRIDVLTAVVPRDHQAQASDLRGQRGVLPLEERDVRHGDRS